MEQFDGILLARTALAAALGFFVGYLRERRGSPAGDRTYAMVALGAAAFTGGGWRRWMTAPETGGRALW